MAKVARADLREKLDWFGPIRFVTAEWVDNARLVLLRYAYRNGHVADLGVRIDLDKRAFIDEIEDEAANKAISGRVPEIWEVVSREYAQTKS